MTKNKLSFAKSSYRDPSGYVFKKDSVLYRTVNKSYKDEYDALTKSFYKDLIKKGLIVPHKEVNINVKDRNVYKVIEPKELYFTNYPYEWTFSQLKDAALLTLKIQILALKNGYILKDATPFNIMFDRNKPIFIDTLSFELREEGTPWVAYRQFCEMFLGPLLLASKIDTSFINLLSTKIDGYDLDFIKSTLGTKNFTNLGVFTHIFLHSQSGDYFKSNTSTVLEKNVRVDTSSLIAMADNLKSIVESLKFKSKKGFWENYYEKTNYKERSLKQKFNITKGWIKKIKPENVIDLGSNDGALIKSIQKMCENYVCVDNDYESLEKQYSNYNNNKSAKVLTLYQDLAKTSPNLGFLGQERDSFINRSKFDCVLSLALIHHLSIRNNLSIEQTSNLFQSLGNYLIIEFVPKDDSNVKTMLQNKKDIYLNYDIGEFEKVYTKAYKIIDKETVRGTKRTLYLMKKL